MASAPCSGCGSPAGIAAAPDRAAGEQGTRGNREPGEHGAREFSGRAPATVTVTFAGSGDAFGSGGRYQACIHLRGPGGASPVLLDSGATSLSALRRCGLDPGEIAAVFVSHLHGDHFGAAAW